MLMRLVLIALASYGGFCLLLYLTQDSQIFFPQPPHVGKVPVPPGWTADAVSFKSHDALTLQGILVRPPGHPAPLMIFYGGNAEEISYMAQFADLHGQFALLLVNYRGYGGNPGKPGERALVADALAIYDQALTLPGIRKDEIYLHGRSLGTGIAVAVAAQRPVRKLILATPYDSFLSLARTHFRLVPTGLLLRHRFDSMQYAQRIQTPTLFLVAEQDEVIPPAHAKTLFDAWGAAKQWKAFPGRSHNDVSDTPGYWDTIAAFLRSPPQ